MKQIFKSILKKRGGNNYSIAGIGQCAHTSAFISEIHQKYFHIKKFVFGLCLFFLTFTAYSQGLEDIVVEKYYVSDAADSLANDAVSASPGTLPVGSVTYRVYVDMAAGYKLQYVYGVPLHELNFKTTTLFYNNEDRGAIAPNGITTTQTKSNTVMLDSWLSLGATASGKVGVLKTDDTDGSIGNSDGVLANTDASAGIPVSTQDGMIAGTPSVFAKLFGAGSPNGDADLLSAFGAETVAGTFTVSDGSYYNLSGVSGVNADRVLIAQLTTTGALSFELNLQLIKPDNTVEFYVAKNPTGDEIVFDACTYPVVVNNAPTVSIITPSHNATFTTGDVVAITADATDDGTISAVEFFVNGASIGTDNFSPYSYNWTSTQGTKNITAVARDDKGKKTTSAVVTISVLAPGNTPPTGVGITSPANGAAFTAGDVVVIEATATDDDMVTQVEFFKDGVSIGTDDTSPYQFSWTSVAGTHTLTAVAIDNQSATTTSSGVTISVNDTPSVSITVPANNTVVLVGTTFTVTADATDDDGTIAAVQFFADGLSIGTDADNLPPYSIVWTATVSGTHTLTAVATDNQSATTTSSAVTVSVNTAPSVSITAPADNTTILVGTTFTITANATDDGSISSVQFFADGLSIGTDADSLPPYTVVWTATVSGTHTLTAVAADNQSVTTTSSAVTVSVNTAPSVSITAPADNTSILVGTTFTITANATDDGSISSVQFFADGVSIGTDADSLPPYTVVWTNTLTGTYTLTAIATDNNGAKTTSVAVIISVVELPNVAPEVEITSPADGTEFSLGNIVPVAATATDVDGDVYSVEFFVDGVLVGTDDSSPYTYNWPSAIGTAICLTAVATDNDGAKTTSACVTISVEEDTDGIEDINSSALSFNLYPSPTTGLLTIEFIALKPGNTNSYAIYGIKGNMIARKELGKISGKYSETIDISSFVQGQYIIELSIDGAVSAKQIIKN